MTDLRKTAQQALEALERCAVKIEWEWGDCRDLKEMRRTGEYTDETTAAITALRAALAEPEQDAFCDTHCTWRDHHPDCVRAEPGQPVAIKWTLNGDKHCGYDNWVGETPFGRILITWKSWKEFPEACVDEFPGDFTAYGDPEKVKVECEAEFRRRIGAAPTPRKPLSLDEIEALLWDGEKLRTNVEYARAIEIHHGITGETK